MADFPCDWHHERYVGESTRVFLNLYRNDQVAALRASVCGDCLYALVAEWLGQALHRDPRGFWVYPQPGQDLEGLWTARREAAAPTNGSRRY